MLMMWIPKTASSFVMGLGLLNVCQRCCFPEMFAGVAEVRCNGTCMRNGLWRFEAVNPRRFADNRLGYIDDRPFGGGPGMIMMAEPVQTAIDAAKLQCIAGDSRVIYLSPQGRPMKHKKAVELSQYENLILLCGRYEGVDERVLTRCVDEEKSPSAILSFQVTLPAMMLMDAVLRLVPGVLGVRFLPSRIRLPMGFWIVRITRVRQEFQGMAVPEVLRSGNHAKRLRSGGWSSRCAALWRAVRSFWMGANFSHRKPVSCRRFCGSNR